MILIKPSVEIIPQDNDSLVGVYKHAELIGRVAYKSETSITDDPWKKFLGMIVERGHLAVLEHATVYLVIEENSIVEEKAISFYKRNQYSELVHYPEKKRNGAGWTDGYYITTNLRVLKENRRLEDLKFFKKTPYHKERITVKFICDTGISHEFVRHRVFSFMQESTRFCNYSLGKFNNQITYIAPLWLLDWDIESINNGDWSNCDEDTKQWANALKACEDTYLWLINCADPWKPQQARSVLPKSLKTELVMTGFKRQWEGFFKLRCAPDAHPQARELAIQLQKLME